MKEISMSTSLRRTMLSLTAAVLLSPIAVQATCIVTGPIVRVTAYDDSSSTTGCYIYQRNSALASYYYYTVTTDDDMCSNAVVAATTAVDVQIVGNAASCPTTGTARYAGTLNYININP